MSDRELRWAGAAQDEDSDSAVQATNTDATECKCSAVRRGYYRDPYVEHFARRAERKPPEIHRGYYARVRAIDICIHHFLERCGSQCQIINLGCGFDTLFWRLGDSTRAFGNYVELDHAAVVAKKINIIRRTPVLLDRIGGSSVTGGRHALHGDRYHLVAADLRSTKAVQTALEASGALLQPPVPTLVLAECVLVYLPPAAAAALLQALSDWFPTSMVLLYEQCNLDDKFGEVMLRNLMSRGCVLSGAGQGGAALGGPEAACSRLAAAGWRRARAWLMADVWAALPAADRAAAAAREPLDECEPLTQLQRHYALALAARGALLDDLPLPDAQQLAALFDRT